MHTDPRAEYPLDYPAFIQYGRGRYPVDPGHLASQADSAQLRIVPQPAVDPGGGEQTWREGQGFFFYRHQGPRPTDPDRESHGAKAASNGRPLTGKKLPTSANRPQGIRPGCMACLNNRICWPG